MGGLYLGGGGQRVCWPPLSNYWGGGWPPGPPVPTPMVLMSTRYNDDIAMSLCNMSSFSLKILPNETLIGNLIRLTKSDNF